MELNNLEIKINRHNGLVQLFISDNKSMKHYEQVLEYLVTKLKIKEVKEINDYDNYYHLLTFENVNLVLNLSHDFGSSIFILDKTLDQNEQIKYLNHLKEVLQTR